MNRDERSEHSEYNEDKKYKEYREMFSGVQSVHSANPNKMEVIMKQSKQHRTIHKPVLVAAVIAVIAALSLSAYAIVTLLSPAAAAREAGRDLVAEAFENGRGTEINETVASGDYLFTLLGMTRGENLQKFYSGVDAGQTALVVSIRRADGSPLNIMDGFAGRFGSGVFFSGYKPWQVSSIMFGVAGSAFDRDGAIYVVLEVDADIEMFADRTVSYGIWATEEGFGFAPSEKLFNMAEDGTISFAENLPVAHAMFTLPLDVSKADPERVARVLEEQGISASDDDNAGEQQSTADGGAFEAYFQEDVIR